MERSDRRTHLKHFMAGAATVVMGEQVEGTSEPSILSLQHIKPGGKFKALATTWTPP